MSELKLKVRHIRTLDGNKRRHNMGGITVAALVDDQFRVKKYAFSVCHERENFSRRIGFVKATGKLDSDKYSSHGNDWDFSEVVRFVSRVVDSTIYNPPRKVIVLDRV